MLFVLTGCTQQKQSNKAIASENEAYLETLKLLYEEKNQEAYEVISKHEDSKDKLIQYLLGDIYYYGYGVELNDATAFSWYLKSAEQGNRICQYNVGLFYSDNQSNMKSLIWGQDKSRFFLYNKINALFSTNSAFCKCSGQFQNNV